MKIRDYQNLRAEALALRAAHKLIADGRNPSPSAIAAMTKASVPYARKILIKHNISWIPNQRKSRLEDIT